MKQMIEKIEMFLEKACSPKWRALRNVICILLTLLSALSIFLLIYVPICVSRNSELVINAAGAFDNIKSEDKVVRSFALMQLGAFALVMACVFVNFLFVIKQLRNLKKNEDEVSYATRNSVILAAITIGIYTIFVYLFSPINKMLGGYSESRVDHGPMTMVVVIAILYAILVGIPASYRRRCRMEDDLQLQRYDEERRKFRRYHFLYQLLCMMFVVVIAVIAAIALMSDIVTVNFDETMTTIPDMVISGSEILGGTEGLETVGERTVAYFVLVLFYLTLAALVLAFVSFISRSQHCNKMMVASIITSSASCGFVGLFGQYYQIVQELNEDVIDKLLERYYLSSEDLLKYEAESGSLLYCLILIGVLCVLFICRPFSRAHEMYKKLNKYEIAIVAPSAELNIGGAGRPANKGTAMPKTDEEKKAEAEYVGNASDFDPCPAFTELDGKIPYFRSELERKRESLYESPTLPNLVSYIVQYARDSKHHLFYTEESIATFLAGLGATKLTILQGMSGTGKTSLPKIVSEALMSVCDIVEVESSWRDKNELLGYYNEFNKVYTPKKFTQALYKASLNSDTLTFIVLDEMNLSRIEYYFSDFLSLMENEPDKREIKLLNTPLARIEDEYKIPYSALCDGHTLKIPQNVWFIGTANRDESTYDISDKVYDRAHTMNFDKRAQKPAFYGDPIPARYLPAGELIRLFEQAKATANVNIDQYPVIQKAESLLAPYNISFGNRIAMQIEAFVGIYASCFTSSSQVIHDAIDIIMLSKVVKKLELKSVDDKETLALEFDKIGLKRCSAFITGLRED